MRYCKARRTNRLVLGFGRIHDAVADPNRYRIRCHFVLMDLDRTDDAVLDPNLGADVIKFETWLTFAHRSAITFQPPARHESAMPDQNFRATDRVARVTGSVRLWAMKLGAPACDQQSIKRQATLTGHTDGECVRQISLPIEHPQDRPCPVGRPQL